MLAVDTQGYKYGGLQTVINDTAIISVCFCGNSYGKYGKSDQCNKPCEADEKLICGGYDANTVITIEGQ